MSNEYLTGVDFEDARTKLLANLGDRMVPPTSARCYLPECEAFMVQSNDGEVGIWFFKETMPERWPDQRSPYGRLVLEAFGNNLSRERQTKIMPWVEETLGISIYDEVGLHWLTGEPK